MIYEHFFPATGWGHSHVHQTKPFPSHLLQKEVMLLQGDFCTLNVGSTKINQAVVVVNLFACLWATCRTHFLTTTIYHQKFPLVRANSLQNNKKEQSLGVHFNTTCILKHCKTVLNLIFMHNSHFSIPTLMLCMERSHHQQDWCFTCDCSQS